MNPHKIIIDIENKADMAWQKFLDQLYNDEPELKQKADDIHHHRMSSGNACHQCIAMALERLGWQVAITFDVKKGLTPEPK